MGVTPVRYGCRIRPRGEKTSDFGSCCAPKPQEPLDRANAKGRRPGPPRLRWRATEFCAACLPKLAPRMSQGAAIAASRADLQLREKRAAPAAIDGAFQRRHAPPA